MTERTYKKDLEILNLVSGFSRSVPSFLPQTFYILQSSRKVQTTIVQWRIFSTFLSKLSDGKVQIPWPQKIWKNSSLFLTLLSTSGNFFKFCGLLTISEFWLKSVIFSSALLFIKIFSHIFELTYLVSRQNKTWIYINGDFEFQWFRDEVSKEEQMPEELLSLLFSHLDPIYELHCSFLKDIEQRMATW